MAHEDKTGQKVPFVEFKIRENFKWVTRTSDDYFKNKKVILFALPGAFTPTCSMVHLPTYNDLYDEFKSLGIDDVICLSVNDSYVMNEWKRLEKADRVTMLPDGNGEFSEKLGFLTDKRDQCLGSRSWRYSMIVNDGVIEKMFIEPEDESDDPYGESSPETMLKYLNPKAELPASVTVFTRPGCKFCAEAKELLREKKIIFEELVLNQHFSIKTAKALSGTSKLPQVFINGKRIGGADELKNYFGVRQAA